MKSRVEKETTVDSSSIFLFTTPESAARSTKVSLRKVGTHGTIGWLIAKIIGRYWDLKRGKWLGLILGLKAPSVQSLDQERREEFSMMSSMKWLIAKDETYQITILFKYWFIHGKDDQKGRVLYAKRWQNPIEYNGDCERSKCRVQDKEKMRLVAPLSRNGFY